jgi:hypothetical protein
VGSRGFGGPDNGAEIVRILDPVEQYQKRRFATRARRLQDVVEAGKRLRGGQGSHALMHKPASQRLQPADVNGLDRHISPAGRFQDQPQRSASVRRAGNEHPRYRPAGAQRLEHSVPSHERSFLRRRVRTR